MMLIDAKEIGNLTSTPIIKQNQLSKVYFNLLESLIPDMSVESQISEVRHPLERQFIEYCFDQSKMQGSNQKLVKVEKVKNRVV